MTQVVAILNSKGGTGKTTLATNVAGCLHKRGFKVLLVDSDPQGSARDWHNAQPDDADLPPVVGIDRPTIEKDLKQVSAPFDFVVIDGAAKLEMMSISALKAADLVLIPLQPSGYDIWAVDDLVDAVKVRQEITGGKPAAAFVVSRQIQGTHLANEINGAISSFGLPVFSGRTTQRVVYAEAGQSGLTVHDLEPNGKAAKEIDLITSELIDVLNHEQTPAPIAD